MAKIKGVVVETECEKCKGAGVVPGAFRSHVVCSRCRGDGVERLCMTFDDLKVALCLAPAHADPFEVTDEQMNEARRAREEGGIED
jgi:hypothetical protein